MARMVSAAVVLAVVVIVQAPWGEGNGKVWQRSRYHTPTACMDSLAKRKERGTPGCEPPCLSAMHSSFASGHLCHRTEDQDPASVALRPALRHLTITLPDDKG